MATVIGNESFKIEPTTVLRKFAIGRIFVDAGQLDQATIEALALAGAEGSGMVRIAVEVFTDPQALNRPISEWRTTYSRDLPSRIAKVMLSNKTPAGWIVEKFTSFDSRLHAESGAVEWCLQ